MISKTPTNLLFILIFLGTTSSIVSATPEIKYGNATPMPVSSSACPTDDIFAAIKEKNIIPPVELRVRGIAQRIPYRAEPNLLVGSHGETRTYADGTSRFHAGTDLLGENGEDIRAIVKGKVVATGVSPTLGNYLILRGSVIVPPALPCAFDIVHAHLTSITVTLNEIVEQGVVIGKMGRTGNVSDEIPTHLHIELWAGVYRSGLSNRRSFTRDIVDLYGW